MDLVLDPRRGLAVALRVSRQLVEAQRLAPCDRDGREVADLPMLRAVERDAAVQRHPVGAVRADGRDQSRREADRGAADRPHDIDSIHAGWRTARTISTICATTSSTSRFVVSI